MHLDRGYDSAKTRDLLEILGYEGHIAAKGVPAPIQIGKRWPVERTHSWMNGYGKLRRFTDKRKVIVEFYLYLAAALTVIPPLDQPGPHPLPLADQTHHPPPPVNIICRRLLVHPRRRPRWLASPRCSHPAYLRGSPGPSVRPRS